MEIQNNNKHFNMYRPNKTITHNRKYRFAKQYKKDKILLDILSPIHSLLLPIRDQDIISTLYTQHNVERSKCNLCDGTFINNYVRDFHLYHKHSMEIKFTCYECDGNMELEESDMYFTSWYSLHTHRIEEHEEPDYLCETQILVNFP